MDTIDTLLAFSEWLDEREPHIRDTHESLAKEFVEQWEAQPGTATLAGREPVRGQVAVDLSADALGLDPVPAPCRAPDGRSCVTLGCPIHE